MDGITFIASAGTGAIVAALITGTWIYFNNKVSKSLDYKYSPSNYIVEKRKKAYLYLDGILGIDGIL